LLGQWLTDLLAIIRWSQGQSNRGKELAVVGIGAAGILALMSRALPDSPVTRIGTVGTPVSLLTDDIYASGTPMGILAPGLFRVGDVPHFAALATPARVTFADAIAPRGDKLTIGATEAALSYPRAVFKASGIANQFRIMKDARMEEVADL